MTSSVSTVLSLILLIAVIVDDVNLVVRFFSKRT